MVVRTRTTAVNSVELTSTTNNEYFFTADILKPNAIASLEDTIPLGESRATMERETTEPKASAETVFVQFLDGSVWGDFDGGTEILRNRCLALKKLSSLAGVYRDEGNSRFLRTLTEPSDLQVVVILQRLYASNGNNVAGVVEKLMSMLHNADLHRQTMESHGFKWDAGMCPEH